jgi:hypothetical protein
VLIPSVLSILLFFVSFGLVPVPDYYHGEYRCHFAFQFHNSAHRVKYGNLSTKYVQDERENESGFFPPNVRPLFPAKLHVALSLAPFFCVSWSSFTVVQVCLSPDLLPELADRHFSIVVLVENLGSRQIEIFLRDVHSSLSQCIHSCFRANTLQFSS